MTATWPVGVPYKAWSNTLRVTPFRAPRKTDMEDGPPRRRPSSTLRIATLAFGIRMDLEQMSAFKDFVAITLADGTLPFTMPVWTGADYEDRLCTFTGPYQAASTKWPFQLVSLTVEVEDY